jgi:hypothetical protein
MRELCIQKAPGEKLGISIRGGAKGHAGNPCDPTDEGIFISKVRASSLVLWVGAWVAGSYPGLPAGEPHRGGWA